MRATDGNANRKGQGRRDRVPGLSVGWMMAMNRKAWVSQLKRHVEQYGAENASWYVNWRDPDGRLRSKSCGAGPKGRKAAEALAEKTHAELVTGTYESKSNKSWESFRRRYQTTVIDAMDARSAELASRSLDTFERIAKPIRIDRIDSEDIAMFTTKRKAETVATERRLAINDKPTKADKLAEAESPKVSPATVNKALRYIKAALRTAVEWGDLPKMPRIRFLKEPKRLPTYMLPEHFSAIYAACETASFPKDLRNVAPCDWWRGLIVTTYLTGWRIGQLMALRWSDIDMEQGFATTRADDNKGKRDMRIPLHPMIVEHLRAIQGSFAKDVFPWPHERRRLWSVFNAIQARAVLADGSPLPRGGKAGQWYGFHDLRRAFATMNAGSMNLFELQQLMQHRSLTTTQGYVNMASQLNRAVGNLFVPSIPTAVTGGAG